MKGCRGFSRKQRVMLYDLTLLNETEYIGRKEGSEVWCKVEQEGVVLLQHAPFRDQSFQPLFEQDVVKDAEGNLFTIQQNKSTGAWELQDLEDFKSSQPLTVDCCLKKFGHMFLGLVELRELATQVDVLSQGAVSTGAKMKPTPILITPPRTTKRPAMSAGYSVDLPEFMKRRQEGVASR